jgi:hypothetical protein
MYDDVTSYILANAAAAASAAAALQVPNLAMYDDVTEYV